MSIFRILGGYIIAVSVVSAIGLGSTAMAAEASNDTRKVPAVKDASPTTQYHYVAQPGDTYTQMVRKAVQTYGIIHKKEIGQPRIVAIETKASSAAGWPILSEGQSLEFTESNIAALVEAAMSMPEAEVAAWSQYTPYINFDTRMIGE